MFIDEADLHVRGGSGGNGCVSFRREKYVPRGGPDGGDGGDGGSVILRANPNMATLLDFNSRPIYEAERGSHGRGQNKQGRSGKDLILDVPPGTLVTDAETGFQLRDLTEPGETVVVARGGRGGHGNRFFATPTHRTPREVEDGEAGEERRVHLELKMIADVGLVGLPNAGKSTLLSRISSAHPKIADYPFTTLEPNLGIVQGPDYRRLVVADLPGLIEGAHQGLGLGDEFLKHIERTRILCHVVDMAPLSGPDPLEAYRVVRRELSAYSETLAAKPHVIAANKMELTEAPANLDRLHAEVAVRVMPISAVTGRGVDDLIRVLVEETEQCS